MFKFRSNPFSLYVYDMIIIGDDHDDIESLKRDLIDCFTIKDLGLLHYFLELKLYNLQKVIFYLRQTISHIFLNVYNFWKNKTVDTPL